MAQRLLAITLGTTSAKLSEIAKAGKKVHVFSCYDIQISEGLCDDGVILDPEGLAQELKYYISNFRIKTKKVVFSIASKRIASKEVIIPFVKEKQIKSIIDINAPEYFPVANIDDYALNYSIIELLKTEENTQYRMNVTATPNELLLGYQNLAEALGVDIDIIDFAGNAILQILKYQTEPGAVCAILQLGYENTVINLMNGSVQIMQRTVSNGLSNLIAAVCDSVGLDEEDAVAFLEDNDIMRITAAYPDVKYVFDQMLTSIGRIFEFYNTRSANHPISYVKFIGDATYVNGIGPALEMGLGYQTEEIFTLKNVDVKSRTLTPEHATNFMSNIGSVIAPMGLQYVDKDAKDKDKGGDEKLPWNMVIISALASAALLGATFTMTYFAEEERDDLKRQLNAVSDAMDVEAKYSEVSAKINAVDNLYANTQGPGDSLTRLISDFEARMPKGMSITSLSLSEGNITITAGCKGKESVARFIQEMKDLSYVRGVRVEYISESLEDIEIYDTFNMTFDLMNVDEIEQAEALAAESENESDNESDAEVDGGEQ